MRFLSLALPATAVGTVAILTVAVGQSTATDAADSAAKPSVLTGAYSEEQAIRGQSLYAQHCLACHGDTMAGLDQAPPLAGPEFSSDWEGAPLLALVDRIGTMPPDQPDILSRSEHVDILTYILWYNGLPLGEVALGTERGELASMAFETALPVGR